jgi:hypothetical protein
MLLLFTNSRHAIALKIVLGVALALAGALTGHVLLIVAAALVFGTTAIGSVRPKEHTDRARGSSR